MNNHPGIPKTCKGCGKVFLTTRNSKLYHSAKCREDHTQRPSRKSFDASPGNGGTAIQMLVAAKLTFEGWLTFLPLGPNGPVDVIAFKDGVTRYIECRTGWLDEKGCLQYTKKINPGWPTPTEFAIFIPSLDRLHYIPIMS